MADNKHSMHKQILGHEQKRDPKNIKFIVKRTIDEQEEKKHSQENAIDIPSSISPSSFHKKHEKQCSSSLKQYLKQELSKTQFTKDNTPDKACSKCQPQPVQKYFCKLQEQEGTQFPPQQTLNSTKNLSEQIQYYLAQLPPSKQQLFINYDQIIKKFLQRHDIKKELIKEMLAIIKNQRKTSEKQKMKDNEPENKNQQKSKSNKPKSNNQKIELSSLSSQKQKKTLTQSHPFIKEQEFPSLLQSQECPSIVQRLMYSKFQRQPSKSVLNSKKLQSNIQITSPIIIEKQQPLLAFFGSHEENLINKGDPFEGIELWDPLVVIKQFFFAQVKKEQQINLKEKSQETQLKIFLQYLSKLTLKCKNIRNYFQRILLQFIECDSFLQTNLIDFHNFSQKQKRQNRYQLFEQKLIQLSIYNSTKEQHKESQRSSELFRQLIDSQSLIDLNSFYQKINDNLPFISQQLKLQEKLTLQCFLKLAFQETNEDLINKMFTPFKHFKTAVKQNSKQAERKVFIGLTVSIIKQLLLQLSENLSLNIKKSVKIWKKSEKNQKILSQQEWMHHSIQIISSIHLPFFEKRIIIGKGQQKQKYFLQSSFLFDSQAQFEAINHKFVHLKKDFFLLYFFDLLQFVKEMLRYGFSLPLSWRNLGVKDGRFAYKITDPLIINRQIAELQKIDPIIRDYISQLLDQQKNAQQKYKKLYPISQIKMTFKPLHFSQIQENILFMLSALKQFLKLDAFKDRQELVEITDKFNQIFVLELNNQKLLINQYEILKKQFDEIKNSGKYLKEKEKQELQNMTQANFVSKRWKIAEDILNLKIQLIGLHFHQKVTSLPHFKNYYSFKQFQQVMKARSTCSMSINSLILKDYCFYNYQEKIESTCHSLLKINQRNPQIYIGFVGVSRILKNTMNMCYFQDDLKELFFNKFKEYTYKDRKEMLCRMMNPMTIVSDIRDNNLKHQSLQKSDISTIKQQFLKSIAKIIANAIGYKIKLPVIMLRHFLMGVIVTQNNQQLIVPKLNVLLALLQLSYPGKDQNIPTEYFLLNASIDRLCLPLKQHNEVMEAIFLSSLIEEEGEIGYLRQMLTVFESLQILTKMSKPEIKQEIIKKIFQQQLKNNVLHFFIDNGVMRADCRTFTRSELYDFMKGKKQGEGPVVPYQPISVIDKEVWKKTLRPLMYTIEPHQQTVYNNKNNLRNFNKYVGYHEVKILFPVSSNYANFYHTHYKLPLNLEYERPSNLGDETFNDIQGQSVQEINDKILKMQYQNMNYLFKSRNLVFYQDNKLIQSVFGVESFDYGYPHRDFEVVTYFPQNKLTKGNFFYGDKFYHNSHLHLQYVMRERKMCFHRLTQNRKQQFFAILLNIVEHASPIQLQLLTLSLPALQFTSQKYVELYEKNKKITEQNNLPQLLKTSYGNYTTIIPVFNQFTGCVLIPNIADPNQSKRFNDWNIEGYCSYSKYISTGNMHPDMKSFGTSFNQIKNYNLEAIFQAHQPQLYHKKFYQPENHMKKTRLRYQKGYDLANLAMIIAQLLSPPDYLFYKEYHSLWEKGIFAEESQAETDYLNKSLSKLLGQKISFPQSKNEPCKRLIDILCVLLNRNTETAVDLLTMKNILYNLFI